LHLMQQGQRPDRGQVAQVEGQHVCQQPRGDVA